MNRELSAVLKAFRAERRFIAACTTGALLFGIFVHFMSGGSTYEAEVQLYVSALEFGDNKDAAAYFPSAPHVRAYERLMQSSSVVGAVYDRLSAEGAWKDSETKPTLEAFSKRLTLQTTILDETTRPVNYAPMITLRATASTPERAQAYADAWADEAVAASREAMDMGLSAAVRAFESQTASHERELLALWDRTAAEQAEWNTEVLKNELDSVVALIAKAQSNRLDMEVQRESSAGKLTATKDRLAAEQPTVDLFFSPSDDVFWLLESGAADGDAASLRGKGMVHQAVNEVFVALRERETAAATELAAAEASIAALDAELASLEARKANLQSDLAAHDRIQKELLTKAETFEAVYVELAKIRSYAAMAAGLEADDGESGRQPLGVNRINDTIYVFEAPPLIPGSVKVVLVTALGFAAAALYVAGAALAPLYLPAASASKADA